MARPIGPRTVAKAIAIIEDSQHSHRMAIYEPERMLAFGSVAFHKQCIKEYEVVLRLLRRLQDSLDE